MTGLLLDTRGLKCPLPVIKTEKQLDRLPPGQQLRVLADDPVARIDLGLLCQRRGLNLEIVASDAFLTFIIENNSDKIP